MPGDSALARAGTNSVRERQVVVERDSELDYTEQQQSDDREYESEFRHRLSTLVSKFRSSDHCGLRFSFSWRGYC
jgi:hypothetical protein